jgi:hypothetical protein
MRQLKTNIGIVFLLIFFFLLGFYRALCTEKIRLALYWCFQEQFFLESHQKQPTWWYALASWTDTILYSILHSLLIILLIAMYFRKKTLVFYTFIVLSALFMLCVVFLLLYKQTQIPFFHKLSEDLIYMLLSPAPLFLLFAFFKFVLARK